VGKANFLVLLILTVLKNQVFEQAKTHNTTKIVNCLEGKFTFCFAEKKSKSRKGSLVDFEEIKCRDCKYYGLVKAARRLLIILNARNLMYPKSLSKEQTKKLLKGK